MKKLFIFPLILVLVLSGCAEHPVAPAAVDFTFDLPEGYSIAEITDLNCTILRDADGAVCGGIEVTTLSPKSLTEKHAKSIMQHLQEEFHKTNNIEFITSHCGEEHPAVTVHLRKHEDDGSQKMYYHIFFEKESRVYHLWVDEDVAGEDDANDFICVTNVD